MLDHKGLNKLLELTSKVASINKELQNEGKEFIKAISNNADY
jgi:hypothetical protein